MSFHLGTVNFSLGWSQLPKCTIQSCAPPIFHHALQFHSGRLRGLALGGSVRRIFGQDWAVISVGGQEVLPKKKTANQYVVSPFANYRGGLRNATRSAQINVNNLFDQVPIRAPPTATPAGPIRG